MQDTKFHPCDVRLGGCEFKIECEVETMCLNVCPQLSSSLQNLLDQIKETNIFRGYIWTAKTNQARPRTRDAASLGLKELGQILSCMPV